MTNISWADAFKKEKKLLEKVKKIVTGQGYVIKNVDTVILAEEPNLKEYKPQMRRRIAEILDMEESLINIKATTHEGLGAIGAKEGIAAWATVLLMKRE